MTEAGRRRYLGAIFDYQRSYVGSSTVAIALNTPALVLYGVASVLVARQIGAHNWGQVVWFISGTSTIGLFSDVLGVNFSTAYLLGGVRQEHPLQTVRTTVLTYGVAVGVCAAVVLVALPPSRDLFFRHIGTGPWVPLLIANIVALSLIAQLRGLFLGAGNFLLLGAIALGRSGGFGVLAMIAVYVGGSKQAVRVAEMHVAANAACVLLAVLYVMRQGVGRPSVSYIRRSMEVGWRGAGINWLSFLHQRVDQFIVNVLIGSTALGLYGAAVALGEVITQVPAMIGNVLFALSASAEDPAEAARAALRRTAWIVSFIAVAMIPLWRLTPVAISMLYGPSFAQSASLLRFLLPGIVFLAGLTLINQHVAGMGYPRFQLLVMLAAVAANACLNLILVPRIGVVGASIASSLSYGAWFGAMCLYLIRRIRQHDLVASTAPVSS